jgi:hypothetical protein
MIPIYQILLIIGIISFYFNNRSHRELTFVATRQSALTQSAKAHAVDDFAGLQILLVTVQLIEAVLRWKRSGAR